MRTRVCRTISRLCPAMWVGAAFLFVATSVTEQVQPGLTPATKDVLALIRFPWYYGTGATLLVVAFVAASLSDLRSRPRLTAMLLLGSALAIMGGDFLFVYRPLREAMTTPDSEQAAFERLHDWSERLNVIGFLLSAAAAVLLCAATDRDAGDGRHS